jgi:hypothetical protein
MGVPAGWWLGKNPADAGGGVSEVVVVRVQGAVIRFRLAALLLLRRGTLISIRLLLPRLPL